MLTSTQNKKAVIYCRVSTKEQVEEGNSLVTQEKICKEYALKNGYDIAVVFMEQGESAKTQDRTELRKLLTYCAVRKNGIQAVISYKIDRISRNTDDYSQIRILLKRYGVEIKSTSEYFENTPAGRFMENIIANVAQFDNDVRTERSINGMRDATREGRYVWMAPIGYDNVKIAGKVNIAPNTTAVAIQQVFEAIANNVIPIEEVRKQFFSKLVNKKGTPISKSYFYYMLKNELYAGWIVIMGERHKGIFEPIISETVFDQVQRVLKYRKRRAMQYNLENPDFPLRRFLINPSGRKLSGGWSKGRTKKYPYYLFRMPNMNFKKEVLEEAFMAYLNQFELHEKEYDTLKRKAKENLVDAVSKQHEESIRLEKNMVALKEKQNALIQKNIDGVISNNILREQLEFIEKEMMNSYTAINKLPKQTIQIENLLDFVSEYLKSPAKIWAIAPFAAKLKLQWFNFPKGIIFDGTAFRTTEIASVFNMERGLLPSLSHRVHYSRISLNRTTKNPLVPTNSFAANGKFENEPDWQKFATEVQRLSEIIKEIQE